MSDKIIKSNITIDAQIGALILIDMLYTKKLINKETYNNIQNKYKSKSS